MNLQDMPAVGRKAPAFTLPDQDGIKKKLKDYQGSWVVLYFYPRDNTPGCTVEANEFSAKLAQFRKLGAVILGVSPDSSNSHAKFCEKQKLKITLLSDSEHKVLEKYGAWQLKKMYGRESYGVVRSTLLIDPDGKIAATYPKVKAKGHAEQVLKKLKELQKTT